MCWLERKHHLPVPIFFFFLNPISSIFLTTELTNKDRIHSNLTSGGVPVRSRGHEPSPDRSHQPKGKILPKMASQLGWPTLLGKGIRGWIKGRTFESWVGRGLDSNWISCQSSHWLFLRRNILWTHSMNKYGNIMWNEQRIVLGTKNPASQHLGLVRKDNRQD